MYIYTYIRRVEQSERREREESLAANSAGASKFIEDMELSTVNQERMRL